MGDVSVMARRLPDGRIEYGWSGNGGYFRSVGKMLLLYDTDELADELFCLGQLSDVGFPHSEHGLLPEYMRNSPIGSLMYHGDSERCMFDRIVCIDYGYFRELDGEWYSVRPGPFCIKMPLHLVKNHLDDCGFEYDFFRATEAKIMDYMLTDFVAEHEDFRVCLSDEGITSEHIHEQLSGFDYPLYDLCRNYSHIAAFLMIGLWWIAMKIIRISHRFIYAKKFQMQSAKRLATGTSLLRRNPSACEKSCWAII